MRCRYEVFCDGRLLKVFDQIDVTTLGDLAKKRRSYVDGTHYWKIDEQEVADDVAAAMIARYQSGETGE